MHVLNPMHLDHTNMQHVVLQGDERWDEIWSMIKFDQALSKNQVEELWTLLEDFKDVFAWHKGKLGCCTIGEHAIDTQGFPPCRTTPRRLSYQEENEVNRQIHALIKLGKMKNNDFEYAYRVSLHFKKDGSRHFCGDYKPLNMQMKKDSFPMLLIDDVLSQMGSSQWFNALDLQFGFWQIRMSHDDVKKTVIVTKSGFYDWTMMPFGLKNAIGTFSRTMAEVFKDWTNQFLKVFVDDVNIQPNMGRTPYTFEGYFYTIAGGKFEIKPQKILFWCTTDCISRTCCDQTRLIS